MRVDEALARPGAQGWWPHEIAAGRLYGMPTGRARVVCGQAATLSAALPGDARGPSASRTGAARAAGRAVFALALLPHLQITPWGVRARQRITLACEDVAGTRKFLTLFPPQTPVAMCASASPLEARGSRSAEFLSSMEGLFRIYLENRNPSDPFQLRGIASQIVELTSRVLRIRVSARGDAQLTAHIGSRMEALARMSPFLHRNGDEDALAAPVAFAFHSNRERLAFVLAHELIAVDSRARGLGDAFTRCAQRTRARPSFGVDRVLN